MVYKVKVSRENNFKLYYGTCEGEFKSRWPFKVNLATERQIQKFKHTLENI